MSRGPSTPVMAWREREGVEPTAPTAGPGPTDLKSANPTRDHPLPRLVEGDASSGLAGVGGFAKPLQT